MKSLINGCCNNETAKLDIYVVIIEPKIPSGKVEVIISNHLNPVVNSLAQEE
jgi:hypothetical protein